MRITYVRTKLRSRLLSLPLLAFGTFDITRNFGAIVPATRGKRGIIFLGNPCDSERISSRGEVRWNNNENHPVGLKLGIILWREYPESKCRSEERFFSHGNRDWDTQIVCATRVAIKSRVLIFSCRHDSPACFDVFLRPRGFHNNYTLYTFRWNHDIIVHWTVGTRF